MTALISALDNNNYLNYGENGSTEYTWSTDVHERILQLSFQLTRTKELEQINKLALVTEELLKVIASKYYTLQISYEQYFEFMSILYRMIGQTRDIIDGKGEYNLSYMLLSVWNKLYPSLAEFAFRHFVLAPEKQESLHPYGSWKDIKYLYHYDNSSSLVDYGLKLVNQQIRIDLTTENPSLAAKWVPRENSKFGNLFNVLALDYFSEFIQSALTITSIKKAETKAKMEYRKIISSINKRLDTVQIKQCANDWASIVPSKQTSITMSKQKLAFLNKTKLDEPRSKLPDRIICAEHFTVFAEKACNGEVKINGKRVGLNDFTSQALNIITRRQEESSEAQILNAQWRDNSSQNGALGKIIAMVDVSGSMSGEPLNAAIALGIRVAEKSILGKRILTFSASPTWVNLSEHNDFVDMVKTVLTANWGLNTNFEAALSMILDAIIENKLAPEDVEDMVLAIFSDMQMDDAQDESSKCLMNSIEQKYAEAGMRLWNKPFKPPHILFWNLRSTSGFPTLMSQKNASMMSGFSPVLLNLFCQEGISSLQSCTPWSLFIKSLDNERYKILEEHLRSSI